MSEDQQSAMVERQISLERDMRQRGFAKAVKRMAADDGQYDKAQFRGLIGPHIETLAEGIAEVCLGYLDKPGRPNLGVRRLLRVDPEKSAAITLDCGMAALTRKTTLLKLALQVGRSIETQHKLEAYEDHDKKRFSWLYREAVSRSSNTVKVKYDLLRAMSRDEVKYDNWTKEECIAVGFICIDQLSVSTKLIELERVYQKQRYTTYVVPTEAAGELMTDMIRHKVSSTTQYGPLVCPPQPWRVEGARYVGGYYTPEIQIPFIKTKSREFKRRLTQHDMTQHVTAVNHLQSVAFQIDPDALAFAMALLEAPEGNPAGIATTPKTLPEKPAEDDERAIKEWRREVAEVHQWNSKLSGKVFQTKQILQTACEYSQEPAIWFAINCDFRGRLNYYAGSSLLTPQGNDLSKSLLRFAEPTKVEGTGVAWFLIHGANLFGVKGTLEDRFQWAGENEDYIVAAARKPMEFDWWQQADSPLQFLRWCREYDKSKGQGEFYTQIPIHMDGTCNGIQHLAAMTRDTRAAAAVNLLPSDKPQDMYQIVADLIGQKMSNLESPVDIEYALMWLRFGFDRNLTKRQCMTKSYGSTQRSCMEYTADYVRTKLEAGAEDTFGTHRQQATVWMSQMIWDSINELVTGPQETMEWLKTVARAYNKAGLVMEWTTPTGFLVHHYYPEWKTRQVKTFIDGKEVKPRIREECQGTISKTEVTNGISANFVHSMDAAHLVKTINTMFSAGCRNMVTIHDSVGVPPQEAHKLASMIRGSFIAMYTVHDPLKDLAMRAKEDLGESEVPPLPEYGSLVIRDVIDAPYFFS